MNKDNINKIFFNLNPLPSWVYDIITLEIQDVNIAAIDHYGYSKKEFLKMTLKDIRPIQEIPKLISALAIAEKSIGNIYFGIFTHQKKNGTLIQMEINGHKIDFDGKQCMLIVCQDVTKKIEQEEQILQSEQRFKALVQEGGDLIGILDIEGNYIYVSPTSISVLGIAPEEFIGRSPFEFIHPDDTEKVLSSLQKIATERKVLVSPFRFRNNKNEWRWIETVLTNMLDNPAVNGIVANSRDITKQKQEEQQLKLITSVITNTNDAVLITEAEPFDEPGPKIIYVNEAFTKMTGYSAEEVIGKTPRLLQGPNSNQEELAKLSKALRNWESCEITIINYKKNGEEFWVTFTVSPVANEEGWYTHWIAIERDVTEQKQKELEKELIGKISLNFSSENDLFNSSKALCQTICDFGTFDFVELWLPNTENTQIQLIANHLATEQAARFSESSKNIRNFKLGEGLSGTVWSKKETLLWKNISKNDDFKRKEAAIISGINSVLGIPLFFNEKIVGVLVVATCFELSYLEKHVTIFKRFENFLGSEINRKKLENDLSHLYDSIPDILCMVDFKGRFLKINKLGSKLLGYSEGEILYHTFNEFVHPDDRDISTNELMKLTEGETIFSFENRYITKNGEIIWLSWSCNSSVEEELVYASAKNITKEKKLRELNRQTRQLAKVGGWEYDLIENKLFWSKEVHRLHETDPNTFVPNVNTAIDFYKEEHKSFVTDVIFKSLTEGVYLDYEAIIINKSKKERWVRVIGSPEFIEGKCVKFIGSFQDITDRKEAEARLHNLSDNIPGVVFQYLILPDGTHELRYVSKGAKKIWGYSSEEVTNNINLVWNQIKEGGDSEAFEQSIMESVENKSQWFFRYRAVSPDGEKRILQGFGTPEFLPDGTVLYNSVVLDITQETKNEELLAQVTKIAKIGSWELNIKDNKMFWSDTVYELHEIDPKTFEPDLQSGISFYREDFRNSIEEQVAKCIQTGNSFEFEAVIITAKMKERWVRVIVNAGQENGKCSHLYGSFQDIDERKKSEEAIRDSEEKRRLIMSGALDAIITIDINETITFWNPRAEVIFGWKDTEVLGQQLSELIIPKPFRKYHNDGIKKYLETGEGRVLNVLLELSAINRNGEEFPIELTIIPIKQNGEVFFCAFIRDITERKKAEKSILKANERFEKVTEATSDAIWDWNIKEDTYYRSQNINKFFGETASKKLINKEFWNEAFHKEDLKKIKKSIAITLKDPNISRWEEEYRIYNKSGNIVYVNDRGVIIRDDEGEAIRIIGAMTDITKTKTQEQLLLSLNESLQAYAKELERSNEELESFAFTTSHDLQEPLRMISSFMDQLKRKYADQLDEKALQYIHFATDGAKRMKQIILDLLDYSRAGKTTESMEEVDVNDILSDFKLLRRKIITEKKVTLSAFELPIIYSYKAPITQLLHALLDNAIKYSKEGIAPKIEINAKENKYEWVFAIKDNGIGIDSEFYNKIFIIFQRLHNNNEYEGTGIGLSIAKKNVEFLGGKIWLESEPNNGAVFYFTIPKS